jgi:23S rRNA (guanosine2251-2'-O)-methyltransferase
MRKSHASAVSAIRSTGQPFVVRECLREDCRLRLPVLEGESRGERCPRCGGPTRIAARGRQTGEQPIGWTEAQPHRMLVLVDNVRSTFNVGSILRIADGVGVERAIFCGITPTPGNPGVAKTALGAEDNVRWQYYANALEAAAELRTQGVYLWALENAAESESMLGSSLASATGDVALVVGNELTGIDPELIALCERVLHIPMAGCKGSLNVAVAFGIAAYWLRGSDRRSERLGPLCA